MNKTFYYNGKATKKKDIPKSAKLKKVVNEEWYESEDYSEQQYRNGIKYLTELRHQREDMEAYHG